MEKVRRLIRWFEKDQGDALLGEADLSDLTLSKLQALFNVSDENPMYDCYPVLPKHVEGLSPHVSVEIELNRYDYFVEIESISQSG